MQFERQVQVEASRQEIWGLLWDVPRVVNCVPGCETAEEIEPYQRYRAVVREKVGPFKVRIPLDIDILESTAPRRLVAKASGREGKVQSHVKVEIDLTLVEVEPHVTELRLQADVAILGKLGTLGHSVIVRKGDEIVGQFADALQAALQKEAG
ncbi:MAG: SRPBCC domain-containing protein [Candidatus Tectomicrobia bacterium]|nr:SRPBCC domain-containing protein [Candidatus Tectomicrobia bacterium]